MSLISLQRREAVIRRFGWTMLAISIWAFFYGAELASTSLEQMLWCIKAEYVGIAFLPAAWIVFVLHFTGKHSWLKPAVLRLIFAFPMATLLLVWTNAWHTLHYTQATMDTSGPFPLLDIQPGPWYLIASAFHNSETVYRRQHLIILIGALVPWMANLIYMLGYRPFGHIDFTPYALIITVLAVGFGLVRLRLFDLIPVAREKVIEALREGVLVLDSRNRIIDFNSAAKKLLSSGVTIGAELTDLLPSVASLHQLIQERKNRSTEIDLNPAAGGRFLEVTGTVLTKENRYHGMILLFRDITERKQIEQELQAARQSAESANQAKSQFLANMSHEIRTPIHAILGFAQILGQQPLTAQQRDCLDHITSSGDVLLRLIGDILDLTKIEAGKLESSEELFQLRKTLASYLQPYRFRAAEKGLQFTIGFDEQLPEYLIADAGKFTQVMVNLVGNALKFTHSGSIHVEFSGSTLSDDDSRILLRVAVTDTGIGIPADKQADIFEIFTQADAAINRQYGGSGLGLTIVRELVHFMGGEIQVESPVKTVGRADGPGSRFCFTLPVRVGAAPRQIPAAGASGRAEVDLSTVRVLIVDDNELNQKLAQVIVERMGCRVSLANNGREAVDLLSVTTFDLVLMDIQMPIMDGYTATRFVREKLGLVLPIIGISANVYKENIEQCYTAGMNDYLSKPYTQAQLQAVVKKWSGAAEQTEPASPGSDGRCGSRLTSLNFISNLLDNDTAAIRSMVTESLSLLMNSLTQLEEASRAQDYPRLAAIAHKTRSTLPAIELNALQEPLRKLEVLAKNAGDVPVIEQLLREIRQICQQANTELEADLLVL
jgi:signal transduction histidine kinase/DNA-binding response OmpR family regulator